MVSSICYNTSEFQCFPFPFCLFLILLISHLLFDASWCELGLAEIFGWMYDFYVGKKLPKLLPLVVNWAHLLLYCLSLQYFWFLHYNLAISWFSVWVPFGFDELWYHQMISFCDRSRCGFFLPWWLNQSVWVLLLLMGVPCLSLGSWIERYWAFWRNILVELLLG